MQKAVTVKSSKLKYCYTGCHLHFLSALLFTHMNMSVKEVVVLNASAGFYLVKPASQRSGGVRLKEHRVFGTKEEARASIKNNSKAISNIKCQGVSSPWDYQH